MTLGASATAGHGPRPVKASGFRILSCEDHAPKLLALTITRKVPAMSEAQPPRIKIRMQTLLGKVLFKVYQLKMAWANRFGKQSSADEHPQG